MTAVSTRITEEQLAEYVELEGERKALDQKSRNIGKRTRALADHFTGAMNDDGKETVTRCGYRLTLVDGRPSVQWKNEFIAVAGPLEADRILTDAPRPKRLEVAANGK